ncbi:hypothetical protein BDV34DRAFT_191751 [Aspergillus parasiticus]|uniref:Uncharacterized protein n=1 Tax=Aspergillus parasiticus TaxID=5067 RepID=A0A5N6DQQ4_ASPPA|nr:hypothetical protein BDV34DRAFT_191751 [Aspergillus parasiticus]
MRCHHGFWHTVKTEYRCCSGALPSAQSRERMLARESGVCDQISAPPSDTALSTYFFPFSFLLILVVHVDIV